MLCHLHKPRSMSLSPSSVSTFDPMLPCDPYDSELRCFAVYRRVYVQRDEARQIAAAVQRGERQHTFRVGSLLFRAIGRLLPGQLHAFHSTAAIFPVGYHANRIYWSMRHQHRYEQREITGKNMGVIQGGSGIYKQTCQLVRILHSRHTF